MQSPNLHLTLAAARGSFPPALVGCNTTRTLRQLTCAACSVNESLVFTVTFTFASSFADMSMLATHCQCHKNRNRLATAEQRVSVHVYERSPILSTWNAARTWNPERHFRRTQWPGEQPCYHVGELWAETKSVSQLEGRGGRDRRGQTRRTDADRQGGRKEALLRFFSLRNKLAKVMLRSLTIGNTSTKLRRFIRNPLWRFVQMCNHKKEIF